ncbi:hypothetical protein PIB30_039834 [Stylosanthes scabra]|uniref:CCHC-type domain-containing protein n=1 Tax=Stylosanthes scabra TaxID=79078 RepID=A0ABU6SEQ1_9FABA|nr:hypothetical protein [Stylosanthes scabra]
MTARVYTRAIFNEVKREIEAIGTLNFVEKRRVSTTTVYTMLEYAHLGRPLILRRLVLRRWTKAAKSVEHYNDLANDKETDRGFLLRHGALHAACQLMFFVGAKRQDLFEKAVSGIRRLCSELEADEKSKAEPPPKHCSESVRDPGVSRTKGAPRKRGINGKRRKCTVCKRTGHTRPQCPEMRKGKQGNVVDGGKILEGREERGKQSRKDSFAAGPSTKRSRRVS